MRAALGKYLWPLSLSILCLALAVQSMPLDAKPTHNSSPLRLTEIERQLLQSKACREKFNLGAQKIVARKQTVSGTQEFYTEVLCESHSSFRDNPIHHVVYCDKDSGEWQCARSQLAIRLTVGAQPLVYFENDIEVKLAYEIALKLEAGKYYQGEEMPDAQESICEIKRHKNPDDAELHDVLVVRCSNKEIFISTWCPQKECPRIIGTRRIN